MAGDEGGAVLDADAALDRAFGDVARLPGHADHQRQQPAARPRRRRHHETRADRTSPSAQPATVPDQVFLGLIRGQNFGPPMKRPAKYPATSEPMTSSTSQMTQIRPNSGAQDDEGMPARQISAR
jgi:hypothetical protein